MKIKIIFILLMATLSFIATFAQEDATEVHPFEVASKVIRCYSSQSSNVLITFIAFDRDDTITYSSASIWDSETNQYIVDAVFELAIVDSIFDEWYFAVNGNLTNNYSYYLRTFRFVADYEAVTNESGDVEKRVPVPTYVGTLTISDLEGRLGNILNTTCIIEER